MQSLFPQQGAGAGRASLIEFRAGKCSIASQPNANGKFLVTPEKTKRGKITLTTVADGLVSFKWTNSMNGTVEDDRIVFPGENVFKKVNTGRENDRIYVLKYFSGNQQFMYWMQDKSNEKDAYNEKRINDLMTNPNAPNTTAAAPAGSMTSPSEWIQAMGLGAQRDTNSVANAAATGAPLDFVSLLSGALADSNAASSSGLPVPPTTAGGTNPPAPPRPAATLADLQRAMQQSAASSSGTAATTITPPLQDILNPDDIINSGVLNDEAVQRELLAHLPEGQQTAAELDSTVRSPQFRQALNSLTTAVAQPDNYQSVMSNFSIDPAPGMAEQMAGDGVGAFLTSLSTANPPTDESVSDSAAAPMEGTGTGEEEGSSETQGTTPLPPPPPTGGDGGESKD